MANTAVSDVDEFASVRFKRISRVYLGESIGTNQLPIRSAGQHAAPYLRTSKRATANRDNAASTQRMLPYIERRPKLSAHFEHEFEFGIRRHVNLLEYRVRQKFKNSV